MAGVLLAGDLSGQSRRITSVVHSDLRSGKLVRSVVVSPKPVMQHRASENPAVPRAAATPAITEAVDRIASEQSVSPQLLHSVIQVESNYNPNAVSPKGAQGLMQLIPATARRFGVSDAFNPIDNIQGGARYLKYLLDLYHNDYALALAAYNAGEGAVARYGSVPPYPETRNYLQLVAGQLQKQHAMPAQPTGKPVEADPGAPNHIQQVSLPDGTVRYVTR